MGWWDVPCAGQGSEGAESAALVLVLLLQGVLCLCPVNASAVAAVLQLQSLQEEIVSCCSETNKWPLSTQGRQNPAMYFSVKTQ